MLALRTRQYTSICRLQLHQRFNHNLNSTSTSISEEGTRVPVHLKKNSSRSAFIRTWEPFHSLADAWALLRVIERKYGRVAEAHFLKDHEIKNRYQVYTYVVFRDPESFRRVPKEGQSFHVPAPVIEDKPGGLGLDDIRHLLESTDRDESFELPSAASLDNEQSKQRVIGARIERADRDFYTLPKTDKSAWPNIQLARQFLGWGGFHKLEPIEGSRDIKESEWFEKTELEQVRMRAALQWCSQLINSANPVVLKRTAQNKNGKASDSSTASASAVLKPTAQDKNDKVSGSSTASASALLKPTTQDENDKVSDSSAASASMDSIESSSPSTLDIPISNSKPTDSPLLTETPQPQTLESTQPPPESTTPTTPHPEQVLAKEAMKRQMSRAKQLKTNLKRPAPAARNLKAQKQEETPKDQKPDVLDEFPEEPPSESKGVMATIWKMFGR